MSKATRWDAEVELQKKVAAALQKLGVDAFVQNTGGGVMCVEVPTPGGRPNGYAYWADHDGDGWGCDLSDENEGCIAVSADVVPSTASPDEVAAAIAAYHYDPARMEAC